MSSFKSHDRPEAPAPTPDAGRRPHVNYDTSPGPVSPPADLATVLRVTEQESTGYYKAPPLSVSGQPQYWIWDPKDIADAPEGSWQANWNALPKFMRPMYGVAVVNPSGASWSLCSQIFAAEGHSADQAADLVNKNSQNFRRFYVSNGQLWHVWLESDGSQQGTVIADLKYPNAPVNVLKL
jgi:hypothetical protein